MLFNDQYIGVPIVSNMGPGFSHLLLRLNLRYIFSSRFAEYPTMYQTKQADWNLQPLTLL